jgi:hypothetical protein
VKKNNIFTVLILGSFLVLGCKPKNPDLFVETTVKPLPETPKDIRYTGPESINGTKVNKGEAQKVVVPPTPPRAEPDRYTQVDDEIYKPKVDILFMTDTSKSMEAHQKKLRANINSFSKNFLLKKDFLDFHIGAVSPWDAIRFQGVEKKCSRGELRPLGGNSGPFRGDCSKVREQSGQISYITNDTTSDDKQLNKILADTLSIGVDDFNQDPAKSGPEHEQLFSPVVAALKAENAELNNNFRRSDAHLAIVFLTDTDDFNFLTIEKDAQSMSTPSTREKLIAFSQSTNPGTLDQLEISVDEMINYLSSFKKDNVSVSVYAAMARYNQLKKNELNETFANADFYIQGVGRGPFKMASLVDKMQGKGFDLNDKNFGEILSQFGDDIVSKTLRRTITLDYAPEINPKRPIIVRYGKNQIIAKDDNKGWRYNIENGKHIITISENIQIQPEAGAKFSIEYTPVKK